ncbi:MAG: dihydrodipicolinate synthase family protein [Candidatus Eremiobacteraeota bacterium]|nr:dihydrodipicolinate synthase family protein [Candidatus Eremiobacteraeota bacterium]
MNGSPARIRGVVAAVATPVGEQLQPDHGALVEHSRWLLDNGCDGLNILGTTGGFASFSVAQRHGVMQALAKSGLPLGTMMVGTGTSALDDTVELTTAAMDLGFSGALVIPPFYYKNVSEDGVFAYVAKLVERVRASALRLYLYNFPAMSGVPFTLSLVERLLAAFPGIVTGLKDSSNDAACAAALHAAFPQLDLFPSSESVLAAARRSGYAGCISATVNVTAPLAARVWNSAGRNDNSDGARGESEADALQRDLAVIRAAISSVPVIPAVHRLIAALHRDAVWSNLMPPLHALTPSEASALDNALAATSYGSILQLQR